MKKIFIMLLFISACLIMPGCATRTVGISPSTTPITGADRYVKVGHAKGSSVCFWLLCFPFGSYEPSRSARDDALEHSGGNAMIEVVEDYSFFTLAVISFSTTTVEGTAVRVDHQMGRIR